MVLIEDKFYERYNKLNPNHDFDTHCQVEVRIGTNVKRRYCRAVYQDKAFEREGRDHLIAMQKMDDGAGNAQPWMPPAPATVMIEARRKEYQQNIRNVVTRNPELVEMLRQRYELGQRYEATRRKVFGLKDPKDAEVAAPAAAAP
jgi:hypothetical protein